MDGAGQVNVPYHTNSRGMFNDQVPGDTST